VTGHPDAARPAGAADRATIALTGEQAGLLHDALDELSYDLSHYAVPPSKWGRVTHLARDRIDHQRVGRLHQLLAALEERPPPHAVSRPPGAGDAGPASGTPVDDDAGGDRMRGIDLTVDAPEIALLKDAVRERIFALTHAGDPMRVKVRPSEYPRATLDRLSVLFDRLEALRWPEAARTGAGWSRWWSRWSRPWRRRPDAR
jgi:hypothetical protein